MSWFFAAATTSWLAAAAWMALLVLPVAAVARLLPARRARVAAVLWAAVAVVGLVAALWVTARLPRWSSRHLDYTPHLERPLPHFCFAETARLLGEGTVRVASLITATFWLLGLTRLVLSAFRGASVARALAATAVPLPNPFSPRVFSVPAQAAEATPAFSAKTIGFFRPVVVMPEATASSMEPEAAAAVLLHELDHALWRDPAAALVLSAVAWAFPGLGWLLYRQWRLHSERAADVAAALRVGEGALAKAFALLGSRGLRDRSGLAAGSGPDRSGPALAAALGWVLLLMAAWPATYPRLLMSLVCAFETTTSAWR
ncbi:MAG: hypothetical protein N2512_09320 [Armatimonadetes bacterium]|nr:hypothetical protein [Armatimonadota bacterium]